MRSIEEVRMFLVILHGHFPRRKRDIYRDKKYNLWHY